MVFSLKSSFRTGEFPNTEQCGLQASHSHVTELNQKMKTYGRMPTESEWDQSCQ